MLNIALQAILLFFVSCSSNGDSLEPEVDNDIAPTNLNLAIEIVGADANNPHGDGSGTIVCKAIAKDAIKYGFKFGSEPEVTSINGELEHTFTNEGVNEYVVSVFAYSKTGKSISTFQKVSVAVASGGLKLVWSDEFNTDGAPDPSKWSFETGNGCPDLCGWGNGEKQYYTNRADNVKVEDGVLKIIAKKENYEGAEYTSARLKTQGKYEFTYGRVEIRAKLPSGAGTWPAIWTLGANIDTVKWPACGEIDIMEHWGYNPGVISSATHTPSCSGDCEGAKVGETTVSTYADTFHVYTLEWTKDELRFLIDNDFKYAYKPSVKDSSTWPYNNPQFLILNVAMGGSWFNIDPNFTEATMEIDYIKVYQ